VRYIHAELTIETIEAISSSTQHVITGYNFLKFLEGIQVNMRVIPLTVKLTGEFAEKSGLLGKVVQINKAGFSLVEEKTPLAIEIIHLQIGDAGFKFGVRFKHENGKVYVN
jgi:hypothetical protein